jgi:hypothetical protein
VSSNAAHEPACNGFRNKGFQRVLYAPDGKQIKGLPDAAELKRAVRLLGTKRTKAIRQALKSLIDEMPPEKKGGRRTFNTSQVAAQLQPWPYPLAALYDIALEIEGNTATGREVYDRAWLIFGLFVWESIMARKESWMMEDQQPAIPSDRLQELTKKVFREQQGHRRSRRMM